MPPTQLATMRAKAKNINSGQGYGLTETMGMGAANRGTDYLKHPTSCGKAIPLIVSIVIKDPATGKSVPVRAPDWHRSDMQQRPACFLRGAYAASIVSIMIHNRCILSPCWPTGWGAWRGLHQGRHRHEGLQQPA